MPRKSQAVRKHYQAGLVSVTLVTYNSGRFIRRCLESVLEQTHPSCQVIVIDNASFDGARQMVETEFPVVRFIERAANAITIRVTLTRSPFRAFDGKRF